MVDRQYFDGEDFDGGSFDLVAYSTKDEVKEVLQITETTWDAEIDACIVSADALIDSLLKEEDFTVDPANVPDNISDASKHFAAWMFRRRRDPAGAQIFWDEAKKFLDPYIQGQKGGASFRRVP